MQSMLSSIGLAHRCISPIGDRLDFTAIDYKGIAPIIEERSSLSMQWLQKQLQDSHANEEVS